MAPSDSFGNRMNAPCASATALHRHTSTATQQAILVLIQHDFGFTYYPPHTLILGLDVYGKRFRCGAARDHGFPDQAVVDVIGFDRSHDLAVQAVADGSRGMRWRAM